MTLSFANVGETNSVRKVLGNDASRKRLMDIGFVEGAEVRVVSRVSGSLIVEVKGVRVAIDSTLANRIIVG